MRLMLKNQIMVFNKLLQDQSEIMNKEFSSGILVCLLMALIPTYVMYLFPAFL